MQKQLFILALGLLSFGTLRAQSGPPRQPQHPAGLPQELRLALEKQGVALAPAPARRATTVRKPGRKTTYGWSYLGGAWSAMGRVEAYTYDTRGLVTQIVEADSATQRPEARTSVGYNAAGLQTSTLEENWDGTAWQNQARTVDAYNSANLLTEHLTQVWRNGAWQNLFRTTIAYNAQGHYLQYLEEQWRNNAWAITHGGRAAVTYTAAGAVLEETQEYLDPNTGIYHLSSRNQYTYASPADVSFATLVSQSWANGAWLNVSRTTNVVRNGQGYETSSEREQWTAGAWVPGYRYSTTYLPNGGTQGQTEVWSQNGWVATSRYLHSYDAAGNELEYNAESRAANGTWTTREGYRYLLRYDAANDLVSRVRQNYEPDKGYVSSLKHIYSDFQSIVLGQQPTAALTAQTQLYPNPTTGAVTLELAGLREHSVDAEVVNALGQVVQRLTLQPQAGTGRAEVDLTGLQAGLYTLRLHTAAGLVVKKVVRQ